MIKLISCSITFIIIILLLAVGCSRRELGCWRKEDYCKDATGERQRLCAQVEDLWKIYHEERKTVPSIAHQKYRDLVIHLNDSLATLIQKEFHREKEEKIKNSIKAIKNRARPDTIDSHNNP